MFHVLRYKSRTSQIKFRVSDGSLPQRYFFERSCVARRCNDAEMGLANSLHALAQHSEYNEDLYFLILLKKFLDIA